MNIKTKIKNGEYITTMPYPKKNDFIRKCDCLNCDGYIKDEDAWRKAINDYRNDQNRLVKQFKEDALEEVGLTDHPKADDAFNKAWDRGHSCGFADVLSELEEIADLLL